MSRDPFPYEDIIDLPHPVSRKHKPMDRTDRAAQFAPFAALTGYEAVIEETARLIESRAFLTEESRAELDRRLGLILSAGSPAPPSRITYFAPDERKKGGRTLERMGMIKKLDRRRRFLILSDGSEIPADDVIAIDSPLFALSEDG